MKSVKKLIFLSALFPLLSIGNVYGAGADVAERGGGGVRGGGVRENAGFDTRAGELRRDGAYGDLGGIEGGYVYPAGGAYPIGGYLENTDPFPDDAAENAIYRANQHPGE